VNTENFDEELAVKQLLDLMKKAKTCDKDALTALEENLKKLKAYSRVQETENGYTEILLDLEDQFAKILNGAGLHKKTTKNANKCAELFELVFKYCCPLNENIEVVLAGNEFIPLSIVKKLEKSTYNWESEGTTQTLARITTDSSLLQRLARSKENSTRYEVAANKSTSPEVLAKLAKDYDISDSLWYCNIGFPTALIQYAVISNPSTPQEILHEVISGKYKITTTKFQAVHGWSLFEAEYELEINASVAAKAKKMLKDFS
jgi:hypothetical protein